jgi:hypothetical protein
MLMHTKQNAKQNAMQCKCSCKMLMQHAHCKMLTAKYSHTSYHPSSYLLSLPAAPPSPCPCPRAVVPHHSMSMSWPRHCCSTTTSIAFSRHVHVHVTYSHHAHPPLTLTPRITTTLYPLLSYIISSFLLSTLLRGNPLHPS